MIKTILWSMKAKTSRQEYSTVHLTIIKPLGSLMLLRISHDSWILLGFSMATILTDKSLKKLQGKICSTKVECCGLKWMVV